MTQSSLSPRMSPSAPPPPRARGVSGTAAYGLLIFGLVLLLGIGTGLVVWLLTGDSAPAWYLMQRTVLLGTAMGVGAALCRLVNGQVRGRLVSLGPSGGDWAILGFFVGIALAGYLVESPVAADTTEEGPLSLGQPIAITGPTLDGRHFDLAEYRGKVVLVDFWASWCGPCLAELPHIKAAYDKYQAQGLEVVGVSFDVERSALVEFLKVNPLPWPQIFFDQDDARGFQNPLGRHHGINAIPCLLLLDREGKLIARRFRGGAIEPAVAAALSQAVSWEDRLASAAGRLVHWGVLGLLVAPWWLVLGCGLGGALGVALAGVALRGVLRRPAAAGEAGG